MTRILDTADGYSATAAPTTSGIIDTITGTSAAPTTITAGAGITPQGVAGEIIFVDGTGGVDITSSPQIAAGTSDGERLKLIGTSDTDSVFLEDGTGLRLNGDMLLRAQSSISLVWDDSASLWVEVGRAE